MDRPDWGTYFLDIAESVSARADCRRAKVGAVIVKDNRIVSTGYNGSPAGGKSCLAGECPRAFSDIAPNSPDYSSCVAIHAEANAIAYASHADTVGATIYISGGKMPCDMCSKLILAAGITGVIVGSMSQHLSRPKPLLTIG